MVTRLHLQHSRLSRIAWHTLFWLILTGIFYYNATIMGWTDHFWWYTAWLLPVDLSAVYFTAYFLVPRYLLKKRYPLFFLGLFLSASCFVLLERAIYYYILFPEMYPSGLERPFFFWPQLWNIGVMMYSFVFLFSGLRVFNSLLRQQHQQLELEKQNLRSELAMLRAQVSPHFLFNTLNNIDYLVFKDQKKASDSLVRLSEIMRYMLYEANTEWVPLEREVQYLSCMIDLIRLRLQDPEYIQFEVIGTITDRRIPPMLLVPFVENAFKHGSKQGQSPGITIRLLIDKDHYQFEVFNQLDPHRMQSKDKVGGIGLQNVQRRLDLLYGNNYDLKLDQAADSYTAKLIIPSPSVIETQNQTYGPFAYT